MMTSNDDNFRWDCIKGTRAIKDELDAKFATMKRGEISKYLAASAEEFREYLKKQKQVNVV
jgi:Trp operon repressor